MCNKKKQKITNADILCKFSSYKTIQYCSECNEIKIAYFFLNIYKIIKYYKI